MEDFNIIDIDTAISLLERIKKENSNITVFIINFDENTSERKNMSYNESCDIIRNGSTIAYNQDDFIPHIEVFSIMQKNKENILPIGIMHDIFVQRE